MNEFASGTIELGFISIGYEKYRPKMRQFYANGNWEALAKTVIEGDTEINVDYFYLGRAAEGLGLYLAAAIYYQKALSTPHKCGGVFGGPMYSCEGLSFPSDIEERLNILRNKTVY